MNKIMNKVLVVIVVLVTMGLEAKDILNSREIKKLETELEEQTHKRFKAEGMLLGSRQTLREADVCINKDNKDGLYQAVINSIKNYEEEV